MNNRQVVYAKTHTELFIPNVGSLTQTLPPQNKNIELTMFYTSEGLLLHCSYLGRKADVLVPHANVVLAVLAPEVKS